MHHPPLSRRQLLKTFGAAVGGVAVAGIPGAASAADSKSVVVGVLNSLDGNYGLEVRGDRGQLIIQLSRNATLSRGYKGGANALKEFVPGDEIVAKGTWIDGTFRATMLNSLYRVIEGRILGRVGNRLDTTAGILELVDETSPAEGYAFVPKPLAMLMSGDDIGALAWRDPSRGHHVALKIGARA